MFQPAEKEGAGRIGCVGVGQSGLPLSAGASSGDGDEDSIRGALILNKFFDCLKHVIWCS